MLNYQIIFVHYLGVMDFQKSLSYQLNLVEKIKSNNNNIGHLLLVEHPHVYTIGHNGSKDNLLIEQEKLNQIGCEFYNVDRGGDITYHGIGQLVVYPILDLKYFLKDIRKYISSLEEVVIQLLSYYSIKGQRYTCYPGVWLDVNNIEARKICSIGIRLSGCVSMHGLALNVNTDMQYFKYIIPCGINNKGVTSIQKELNSKISMQEVIEIMVHNFEKVFKVVYKKFV